MMGFSSVAATSLAALAALLPHVAADKPYLTDHDAFQGGSWGEAPKQSFHSSDVKAGWYQVNHFDAEKIDQQSPYMFMAGRYGKWGPSIVSSKDLSLIWADQTYDGLAQTARVWDDFRGERVMSVYSGGAVRIYNQRYELIYSVTPKGSLDGVTPDSHEAMLTSDGTVLMVVCPHQEVDLTNVGGPPSGKKVGNCHVQEVDPVTDEVLFQFGTLDYFKPEDTEWDYHDEDTWDFCHMNSVEKTEDGDFLISYRHISSVILVDGKTAKVKWVMWGKKNMFTDVTKNGSAVFHRQHEPRMTGKNRFTLFDNHKLGNGYCEDDNCSRGLELEYDEATMTVKMVNEWYHPQSVVSSSRGGVQRLPGGNTIVAWGQNPMYTEYTAEGELVMDIQRGQVLKLEHGIFDVITYRIFKGDWEGQPTWPPSIAAVQDTDGTGLYVSWNGATKVDHYVLLMSDDIASLDGASKVVAQSPRTGFETSFRPTSLQPFARIVAMDCHDKIIGFTSAVNVTSGELIELSYNVTKVTDSSVSLKSIPTSAPVTMPTGMQAPFFTGTGVKSITNSLPSPMKMTAAGGFALCLIVGVALFFFIRRRGAARRAAGATTRSTEASYGLLNQDGLDQNDEDFADDKDNRKRRS